MTPDVTAWGETREWLERSRDSKSPSVTKVHAKRILTHIETVERERDELNEGKAVLWRRWQDEIGVRQAAERRVEALEAALREIAAYQGKVTKPLRHAKIARRALEKEEQ